MSNDLIIFKPDALDPNRLRQDYYAAMNDAVWQNYFEEMRRYDRGERINKPRVPLQYGAHIDSLPREQTEPLPASRSLSGVGWTGPPPAAVRPKRVFMSPPMFLFLLLP